MNYAAYLAYWAARRPALRTRAQMNAAQQVYRRDITRAAQRAEVRHLTAQLWRGEGAGYTREQARMMARAQLGLNPFPSRRYSGPVY